MQTTAYEMRISDWSSDVCASDLRRRRRAAIGQTVISRIAAAKGLVPSIAIPRRDSKTVDQTRQVIIKLPIQCLAFFCEVVCKGCVIQPVEDNVGQPLDSSQAVRGGLEVESVGKHFKLIISNANGRTTGREKG